MSANTPLAVIFGVSGLRLTPSEAAFIRETNPFGFIVFGRNIETPEQLSHLTCALREAVGRAEAPVLIDQEGGRVRRLKPPHWRETHPAGVFGALYHRDPEAGLEAAKLNARLIAYDLLSLGVDTNCLPVLDVRHPSAHDIVGDRSFSEDPDAVAALGAAVIDGLLEGGVFPVVKHIPGHGRSEADSHDALPVVACLREDLQRKDFLPFRALANAPFGMTAHIVYAAIDAERPATLSAKVIETIIRGECAFDGLLMTDDLSMKALDGSMEERTRLSLAAGCDLVLHCNGDMTEMQGVVKGARPLDGAALDRWERVRTLRAKPAPGFQVNAALARLDALLKEDACVK